MSAAAATSAGTTSAAGRLRRLYFVRFVFAAAWAGAFAATGSKIGREVAEAEIDRIRGAGNPHASRPR